jgi:HEPN domain-containing protein
MKPVTLEWVNKAEDDFATMTREYRARTRPNYAGVCFHAQQCVEKMLKAYLFEHEIEFSKTHDIRRLLNLGSEFEPEWEQFIDESARLTSYAIEARYPGRIATKELAGNAIRICRKMRKSVLAALDLPDELPL